VLRWLPPGRALAIVTLSSFLLIVADDSLGSFGIFMAVVIGTVALAALVDGERRGATVPIEAVVLAGGLLLGIAIVVSPRDSHDLWSYTMYGRILSVHHANPWVLTPSQFHFDPYLGRVARGWRHTTSIYGPAFEALAATITHVAGNSVIAVRILFTTSFAAGVACAAWIAPPPPARAAAPAVVLLHPAIVLGTVAGGHNDGFVGLGLLAATVLVLDDRPVAAGLAAGTATLVKLTGGIGILALAAWTLAHRGRRTAAMFSGAAAALVGLAYLPLGMSGLSAFVQNRASISRASAWQLPRLLTGLDRTHTPIHLGLAVRDTRELITLGVLVTVVVTLVVAYRLRRADHPAIAVAAAVGAYLVLTPYALPWYPAWIIPVLALVIDRPLARLLALQASVLVVVYELKTRQLSSSAADLIWWGSVLVSVAIVVTFVVTVRRSVAEHEPVTGPMVPHPAG
jgi:hypothetical protein